MFNVKNYFKGGKTPDQIKEEKRRTRAMSVRLSGIPSTIDESSPGQPDFDQWESLGERALQRPGSVAADRRLSRFSFATNVTQDSTAEDIEAARASFRQSMTGMARRRTTMFAEKNEMTEIKETAEDSDSASDEKMEEIEEVDEQTVLDELKHEIMVNYLFQQQCARLWIADGTGEVEGVMLKKSRGNYLACPPALADSSFADSCVELNVVVCIFDDSTHLCTDHF